MEALSEAGHDSNEPAPLIYPAPPLQRGGDLQISKRTLLVCVCNSKQTQAKTPPKGGKKATP